MGLSFATLVNAAMGGTAAYSSGKRQGRRDRREEEKDQREEARIEAALKRQQNLDEIAQALHESQMAENDAQREEALQRAAKLKYDMEHPKAEAPVLGTPEYRKAQGEITEDREKAQQKYRTKQEWEVYGRRPDRSGEAAERTQKSNEVDGNAVRWALEGHGVEEIATSLRKFYPALSAGEVYKSAAGAVSTAAIMKKRTTGGAGSDLEALAGETPSDAPTSAVLPRTPASQVQKKAVAPLSMPPAVVTAERTPTANLLERTIVPSASSNAGTRGAKAPLSTSTPPQNPTNATSPKAGTKPSTKVPRGADPRKYRSDPAYRAWVDSVARSP